MAATFDKQEATRPDHHTGARRATTTSVDRWGSCDVVIATRNRPGALTRCLASLGDQTVDGFGVIVVDDHSDGSLASVVEAGRPPSIEVNLIRLAEQSGPAHARNVGVAASSAQFIVFIDDDVVPSPSFIQVHLTAVTECDDPRRPLVSCGPFVEPPDWTPTPWNLWEARQLKKLADNLTSGKFALTWRQFHTGNNCVPRATFNEVGGFDADFKRAEDDEFGLRLHQAGCRFRFVAEAKALHYAHRSLEAWLAIPRAYAFYDVAIDRQNPGEEYLAAKKSELERRRLPLRVARRLFAGRRRHRLGVNASILAARALYRLGLEEPSMWALSVAYDLSYVQSLRESETA